MQLYHVLVTSILLLVTVQSQSSGRVTFQDSDSETRIEQDEPSAFQNEGRGSRNGTRQGKDLFDWIGFGTGKNVDPYLAKTNQACLSGELAECFKSQALKSFSEFFDLNEYNLNENVKVVRMSRDVVREVNRQPYEYSGAPRAEESEWDQLWKFAARKAEKFVKTVAIEVAVPSWVTGQNEVYAPRFLDEIADEIDTIENKKDTLFSRNQLKKLLIPMLIVLKLFKLKLLLFLPLILGLASFKKFLAFMAIVIPGLIGFFKLYKPTLNNYQPPVYTQSGVGYPQVLFKENANVYPDHGGSYPGYSESYPGDTGSYGQDLAYQGYKEYRSRR
ncbi:uncharacterized protein LOC105703630 [Orussus abietinus]|uniref:uncharacterized protein LOC105703630 n=1 Tax=Orussus abietinus TaxID=222816 RepID=UPI000625897B|nr:uncharacterized protein LOC105703630 [Orussus abietinus]